jgi:hypothetical protein
MVKDVPSILVDHILPFNWNVREVWNLKAERSLQPYSDFDYLLDLPLWSSVPNQGMLFDISPREVIICPERSLYQYHRIEQVDISFPIELLIYQERQWILDGVHRLTKIFQFGAEFVPIRLHLETVIPHIKVLS